jgi:glycosyltransferase involved in cell wall biosynthesis
LKVLHIIESLNQGAVENWLVRMLRHGTRRGAALDWTFYCVVGEKGQLEPEAKALGARVVHSPSPLRDKIYFMRALRRELREGQYDLMHCHHDLVSAVYLLASIGLPIRKRIVHVHNADEGVPTPNRLKAWVFRPLLRCICLAMADRIVGISNHTLDTFLVGRKRRPGKDIVHYYSVDLCPFETAGADCKAFRRTHGLSDGCRILLFAGRMVPEKNPLFALDVLSELRRLDATAAAVYVGSGSLEEAIRERARELKLDAAFRYLGWRNDIAAIMTCCDWFILPRPEHPMEGFGLAVVEAQLAGLRLLLSSGIATDPLLPTACYRRLTLAASAKAWAVAAMELIDEECPSRTEAMTALRASAMDMDRAFRDLVALYA